MSLLSVYMSLLSVYMSLLSVCEYKAMY